MKINEEIKVKGFTRIEDLDNGDVFIFLDKSDPYIVGIDENSDDTYAINLRNGIVTEVYESNWGDRPIEILNVELVIK